MTKGERRQQSHGVRKHFKGKMGIARKAKGGKTVVSPRSHTHGGHNVAFAGWTCGDQVLRPNQQNTKAVPGRYRVSMPRALSRKGGAFGNPEIPV